MRLIVPMFLLAGWYLWADSVRLAVVLTLATLALAYLLLALAVYWTETLVYGRTHHEAVREAVTWPRHSTPEV